MLLDDSMLEATLPIDYKLLLLDLDGTLIGKDSLVSPRVFAAVGKISTRL